MEVRAVKTKPKPGHWEQFSDSNHTQSKALLSVAPFIPTYTFIGLFYRMKIDLHIMKDLLIQKIMLCDKIITSFIPAHIAKNHTFIKLGICLLPLIF